MSEPISLAKSDYWQIRALSADIAQQKRQAEDALQKMVADLHEVMRAAGLDPAINYRLDDATWAAHPV